MKVKLDEGARLPERAHPNDAGLDIFALNGGLVRSHSSATFRTGVHIQLPPGIFGDMRSRSGMMFNKDITTDGTIDEGYTGEIMVKLFNHSEEDYSVKAGDKIAQMVLIPVYYEMDLQIVDELSEESGRGNDGFGSTGR